MVRIDASKTQCFRASLRIYTMQTHDATRHPVGPVPLRHLTAVYVSLTDGGSKNPMFPAFLTDLRLADTWCYSAAGLPPVSTPSCRADLSRHFLVSPLSLLTPVQPHPGNAVFCGELSEASSSYLDLSEVCFFLPPPFRPTLRRGEESRFNQSAIRNSQSKIKWAPTCCGRRRISHNFGSQNCTVFRGFILWFR